MKAKTRKLISVLLVLCLFAGLLPFGAVSAHSDEAQSLPSYYLSTSVTQVKEQPGTQELEEPAAHGAAPQDTLLAPSETQGPVTPVKDQGNLGWCFVFSSVAAIESNLIHKNMTDTSIDLSENHVMYWENRRYEDPKGAMKYYEAYTDEYADTDVPALLAAGKSETGEDVVYDHSAVILDRHYDDDSNGHIGSIVKNGVVLEAQNPLTRRYINDYILDASYRVLERYNDPTPDSTPADSTVQLNRAVTVKYTTENIPVIKNKIMEYGSATLGFRVKLDAFTKQGEGKGSYYLPLNVERDFGHAVQVVGWDDGYSKNNFLYTPPGDGAWIVKNSWGENSPYTDDGFNYISYYEPEFSEPVNGFKSDSSYTVFRFFDATTSGQPDFCDNHYAYVQYTIPNPGYRLQSANTYGMANIYTVKAKESGGNERIKAVSLQTASDNASYTLRVYKGVLGGPTDGMLIYEQPVSFENEGYYRIPLEDEYFVNGQNGIVKDGTNFSVVMTSNVSQRVFYRAVNSSTISDPLFKLVTNHYRQNGENLSTNNLVYQGRMSYGDEISQKSYVFGSAGGAPIGSQINIALDAFTDDASDAVAVLESIAVTTPPDKTAYASGEHIDISGMKVTAVYSDGTTADVTDNISVPNLTSQLSQSDTAIQIQYTEDDITKNTEYPITVTSANNDVYWMYDDASATLYISDKKLSDGYALFSAEEQKSAERAPWTTYGTASSKAQRAVIQGSPRPVSARAWFYNMNKLGAIDNLQGLNTRDVTDMSYMFSGCLDLTTIDVSGFDVSSVTDMTSIFEGCTSLQTIYAAPDTDWQRADGNVFKGCTALVGGNGTTYDADHTGGGYARIDGLDGNPGYFTEKSPYPLVHFVTISGEPTNFGTMYDYNSFADPKIGTFLMGETVVFHEPPRAGGKYPYNQTRFKCVKGNANIERVYGRRLTYSFTMPDEDVEIRAYRGHPYLSIATHSLPTGKVGSSYVAEITLQRGMEGADAFSSIEYDIEGALPDGLTLDKSTGKISGTPTKEGKYSFVLRVFGESDENGYCFMEKEFTLTINSANNNDNNNSGGGGGGGGAPTYAITLESGENGSLTSSHASAKGGDAVTITPKPEGGYETAAITVTDKDGKPVSVTKNSDGTYTFTMPANQVTVEASFKKTSAVHDCPSAPFDDVDIGKWYHEYIDYAVENGLMNGVSDSAFEPDTATSRAMIVTILYRLEGEPDVDEESPFDDVEAGLWYTNAVIWANANGVVEGYGEGKFGPDDLITREQFAAILYRYANFKGYDTSLWKDTDILSYDDADDISAWAVEAMRWAVGSKLIGGRTETTLVPDGTATRAEAATILMRFIESMKAE